MCDHFLVEDHDLGRDRKICIYCLKRFSSDESKKWGDKNGKKSKS